MTAAKDALPVSGTRHLGSLLSPYVDRTLPPPLQHACDLHLVACPACRAAAAAERRLLTTLRAGTPVPLPQGLTSALLGLAAQPPASAGAGSGSGWGPGVLAPGPAPLAVLSRSAPAWHRSPVRAAALAGLAAGASAAAAWSIAVAGVPVTPAAARPSTAEDSASLATAAPLPRIAPIGDLVPTVAVSTPKHVVGAAVRHRLADWAQSSHE